MISFPLASVALAFSSGIILSGILKVPFGLLYWTGWALLAAALPFYSKKLYLLLLVTLILGVVAGKNSLVLPTENILAYGDYIVRGAVADFPYLSNGRRLFLLEVKEIQAGGLRKSAAARVLVSLAGKEDFSYGEELILKGEIYPPRFKAQGIDAILRVDSMAGVARLNKNEGNFFRILAYRVKKKIETIIFQYLSPKAAGIMAAMVLGEKHYVPQTVHFSMQRTGTLHILVVSGFNVGVVSLALILLLKLLRFNRKARFLFLAPALLLYCLVTGASSPVVRATIMALVFCSSYFFRRQSDIYSALSLAVLLILAFLPQQIFDLGFQLSFLSVFAIAILYPRLKQVFRIDALQNKALRFLSEAGVVSLAAWLGTFGLILYRFGSFSPVTVLANLLIVPMATLITLSGFSLVGAALFLPSLAALFGRSCEFLIFLLTQCNFFLLQLPFASFRLK